MTKIEELRAIQLELLQHFIMVCERENLKWYVSHGTLLGTMREEGYLIWDDDIDIMMPRLDYNIMMEHQEWFAEPYYLQKPTDPGRVGMLRLRKDGTTAFDKPLYKLLINGGHHGIYMDILPIDEIEDSGFCNLSGRTIPASFFEPFAEAQFEGIRVRVPAQARKILTALYGYWNWPCGCENIKPSTWFFDSKTDYSVYVKRYTGWLKAAENKKIYLFGAADSLRIWLNDFGLFNQVVCTFDNDSDKWGKDAFGIKVQNPAELPKVLDTNSCLIVVSIWHQEIGKQLEEMGISEYYVFLDGLFHKR
mgnify:CR=1 FL=1